jgi:SAM-dependent methyltransferase
LKTSEKYQGKENLDVMTLAKNYNNKIYNWIADEESITQKKILDFGCGKGEFSNRFSKNIFAVEIDSAMHKYVHCQVRSDISDYDEKFDMIFSSNVLEHINNDTQSIEDIYKALTKNGIVKILVPARMEIYSNMDKMVGHYRRYSISDLKRKFEEAGFQVLYCRYFDFIGYFASFFYKIFVNKGVIDERSLILYDKLIFPLSNSIDKITFGKIIGKNIMLKAIKK